jgi:Thioesterase-like superfamily
MTVRAAAPRHFFVRDGDSFVPAEDATSPWSDDFLHGRLLAGLAGQAMEAVVPGDEYFPARLTVDLFRAAPYGAVQLSLSLARSGRRVKVIDVFLSCAGREVARATGLFLLRSQPARDSVAEPAHWDAPGPATIEPSRPGLPFDMRAVPRRGSGSAGPRQAWFRETHTVIEGEGLSPFVRAALIADMASPIANSGESGLDYINTDFTLYLGRLPEGEWIGLESGGRITADGTTAAQCRLHDIGGPVGWSTVAALRNRRMMPRIMADQPDSAPGGNQPKA